MGKLVSGMTGDGLKDLMTPEELCSLLKVKKKTVKDFSCLKRRFERILKLIRAEN